MPDKIISQVYNSIIQRHDIKLLERTNTNLPKSIDIKNLLECYQFLTFPGVTSNCYKDLSIEESIEAYLNKFDNELFSLIFGCLFVSELSNTDKEKKATSIKKEVFSRLPIIIEQIYADIEFALQEDPAASTIEEIICTYPFVYAVSVYRLAHELYIRGVPILPRMLSEFAHSKTAIDINPGATIGSPFFIDHGTGVVIGETTIIEDYVRIYQGVTLGALSFKRDDTGAVTKGQKRHPTIKKNATLFSGCAVLGGKTVVGENSTVGGNVWLSKNLPADTTVIFNANSLSFIRK